MCLLRPDPVVSRRFNLPVIVCVEFPEREELPGGGYLRIGNGWRECFAVTETSRTTVHGNSWTPYRHETGTQP